MRATPRALSELGGPVRSQIFRQMFQHLVSHASSHRGQVTRVRPRTARRESFGVVRSL